VIIRTVSQFRSAYLAPALNINQFEIIFKSEYSTILNTTLGYELGNEVGTYDGEKTQKSQASCKCPFKPDHVCKANLYRAHGHGQKDECTGI
jgi:hypothetical protein